MKPVYRISDISDLAGYGNNNFMVEEKGIIFWHTIGYYKTKCEALKSITPDAERTYSYYNQEGKELLIKPKLWFDHWEFL